MKYYLAEPAGIGYRSLPTQGARIEIIAVRPVRKPSTNRSPYRERELKSLSGHVLRCRANRSSRRRARIEMLLHSFYIAKRLPRQARIEKSDGIEVESFPKGATIRCTFLLQPPKITSPHECGLFFVLNHFHYAER